MKNVILIGIFGMIGVIGRYLTDQWINIDGSRVFPVSTFSINILGSFLIGIIYVVGTEKGIIERNLALALMSGLLGGFTTFSSYSLQSLSLIERGQSQIAAIYIFASPLLGISAAWAGTYIARVLFRV